MTSSKQPPSEFSVAEFESEDLIPEHLLFLAVIEKAVHDYVLFEDWMLSEKRNRTQYGKSSLRFLSYTLVRLKWLKKHNWDVLQNFLFSDDPTEITVFSIIHEIPIIENPEGFISVIRAKARRLRALHNKPIDFYEEE